MKQKLGGRLVAATLLCGLIAPTAKAAEVFGGGYAHALGHKQHESGADFMLGVRSERIDSLWWLLKPSVHLFGSVNSEVDTDFVAVGLDWPIGIASTRFYVRPGIGLAYTTGEAGIGSSFDPTVSAAERARRAQLAATRIDFGSHVLFEPELALGYRLSPRWSAEVSYVHLSNGQIFHQGKNQGLDDAGVRLNYRFGTR